MLCFALYMDLIYIHCVWNVSYWVAFVGPYTWEKDCMLKTLPHTYAFQN